MQAIDVYRALWCMRGAQFFGIRDCLGLWDKLRAVKEAPEEAELRALWRAARGGDAKGSIEANQQRGDAYTFLTLLGGLAAVLQRKQAELPDDTEPAPVARVYRVPSLRQYGEQGQRVEGVELVDDGTVLEGVNTRMAHWRMKPKAKFPSKAGPGQCGRG